MKVILHHLLEWGTDWCLAVNAMIMTPVWSMFIGLALYLLAWVYGGLGVRAFLALYMIYVVLDKKPTRGDGWGLSKAKVEWLRHARTYRWVANYLPITLHKTQDLPATTSYIFLYHPHGVISMGASAALMNNACDFDTVFPGIFRVGVTLNATFLFPFFRDWLLALNMVSANKETLVKKLTSGTSLVLIPGGAAEALHAHESVFRLVSHRMGVFKLAMETGAAIVPCMGFGENKCFTTLHIQPASSFHRWQQRFTKWLSFSMPVVLNPMPRKTPVHVVVGSPVTSPLRPHSTPGVGADSPPMSEQEALAEFHRQYWQAVKDLYDREKAKYGHEHIPLELI